MTDAFLDNAGQVAIVTGAGRGLGREHALTLAARGAAVVVNDMPTTDGSGADAVVAEIVAGGGRAVAHHGSASDWSAAAAMVDLAVDTFGGLDVLVNNAGILRDRTLVNMSESEWDAVIDVHLKGHFAPLRHAAGYWRERAKSGEQVRASVINTTSGSGLKGNPGQVNYASAKAGIATMTVVAARELERYGVRVNAIAPVARTPMTLATPGLGDKIQAGEGFDRFDPAHVAAVVAWLAGPDCQLSGQVFTVFGGDLTLHRGWSESQQFRSPDQWTPETLHTALAEIPAGPATFVSGLS